MDSDPALQIATALMGASYSVEVMCATHTGWTFPVPLEDVTAVCDSRLDLRYLLRERGRQTQKIPDGLRSITGQNWAIRHTECDNPSANCIIVDRQWALLTPTEIDGPTIPLYTLEEPTKVSSLAGLFERLWEGATEPDTAQFHYEDTARSLVTPVEKEIAIESRDYWARLIKHLAKHPEEMYQLPPRKFEELIAELLAREGVRTTLTPQTRDGGRDILAEYQTPVGRHLCLVECKRHSPRNPVDVSIVRELSGVLYVQRATAAMIATTSYFTKDALRFREPIQYQMTFRDFDAIRQWLGAKSEGGEPDR